MLDEYVLFLFLLFFASFLARASRCTAYQVSNLPYKSVSVAALHRSFGKWRCSMDDDTSVTALLCRYFSVWFIRGVHTRGRTMPLTTAPGREPVPPLEA